MQNREQDHIRYRVHLASPPDIVFRYIATDSGRAAFWADSAEERNGVIHFRFSNGMEHEGRILESIPHRRFSLEYFGGSSATFTLSEDRDGGTDLILVETSVPQAWLAEHKAGWVSLLLTFKAAVDFSVDLRNQDPERSWDEGYVDV